MRRLTKAGAASDQKVGKMKIGEYPKVIAEFLQLEEPKLYTGHCFRRSAATILADRGLDVVDIQRAGGWASRTVAETYVEESDSQKMKIATTISQNSISNETKTQSACTTSNTNLNIDLSSSTITNTTINIYMPGQPGFSISK